MTQEVDPAEKANVVRRMVRSGMELPNEKREALLRLRQRVEQLWQQREEAQAKPTNESNTAGTPADTPNP
jgi:hypothetical protein